jgi:hypothetical protein
LYDATRGILCPACQKKQISYSFKTEQDPAWWNRAADDQYDEPLFANQDLPYPEATPQELDAAQPEIEWLDKLYELRDDRRA